MTLYQRNKLGLGEVVADPINALDYPGLLPDGTFVIWTSSPGARWPDAGRWLRYISKSKTDVMKGFHILTHDQRDALRFPSYEAGTLFLKEQNKKRPQPWHGLRVTTVAEMKVSFGFYVEVNN